MAATLALAYLLCALAPAVTLAFTDSLQAVHCLTARHADRTATDDHDHGAAHGAAGGHLHHEMGNGGHADQDMPAGDQNASGNCCGIFCLTAIAAGSAPELAPQEPPVPLAIPAGRSFAGLGPDRIDRPPIVSLPL